MAIYFRDYFLDWFKNPKNLIKILIEDIEWVLGKVCEKWQKGSSMMKDYGSAEVTWSKTNQSRLAINSREFIYYKAFRNYLGKVLDSALVSSESKTYEAV